MERVFVLSAMLAFASACGSTASSNGAFPGPATATTGTPSQTFGGGTLSCPAVLSCAANCLYTSACLASCVSNATPAAVQVFQELLSCLNVSGCPNVNGGVCDSSAPGFNQFNCNNCISTATGTQGTCSGQFQACNTTP
jgi:hypothetical protein